MKRNGILVCFIGLDGSGKTTHAKILVNKMRNYGVKSEYVYCGWRHFESFIIVIFINAVKKFLSKRNVDHSDVRAKSLVNRFPTIFEYLVLIDNFFQNLKVRLALIRGKNIVCDRYIYDTIVSLAVDLNYPSDKIMKMIKSCQRLFIRPDFVFLIDVPEEIAYQRKKGDPLNSMDYLSKKRKVYLDISKAHGMTILNSCNELKEVSSMVENKVIGYMRKRS